MVYATRIITISHCVVQFLVDQLQDQSGGSFPWHSLSLSVKAHEVPKKLYLSLLRAHE